MDDIQPLTVCKNLRKSQLLLARIKILPAMILAIYLGFLSVFADVLVLLIAAVITTFYILLTLIYTRQKQVTDPEITHEQYQKLHAIKDQFPGIGETISQTLTEQRRITEQQYTLILDLVVQEKTNHIKSFLEIH